MVTAYEISASDLGSAIAIAHRRAIADGFTRTSILGTAQTGTTSFVITVFVSM